MAFDPHSKGGAPIVEASRVGDPIDFEARENLQACHHPLQQSALMFVDRAIGGFNASPPGRDFGTHSAPKVGNVLNTSLDSSDALVVERAPFPAVGNRVRVGTNFVRTKFVQLFALPKENAHVRAEELVRRAGEKVAVQHRYVNQAMRAIVDGIDVREGSGSVSKSGDHADRVDGTDSV